MPVAALPFIKEKSYSMRPALGLTLGGIPGVLVAAKFFSNLDIAKVRWLVIFCGSLYGDCDAAVGISRIAERQNNGRSRS